MPSKRHHPKHTKPHHLKPVFVPPRTGSASAHGALVNEFVHVFVDDQNLFWGLVNQEMGPEFRIDFGQLLITVARTSASKPRGVKTAYIAGVVPDDDAFWQIAKNQGFKVRRGFLGAGNRSKQDDAYLITDLTATLYEEPGPSTIVLVAGDADYYPPLKKAVEKGWRTEVVFTSRGLSMALDSVVHEYRALRAVDIQKFV
jgi:uncharacterized LabA/DUF88 family protein